MANNDFSMPEPRVYSFQDLLPKVGDPECNPEFPLCNFWPVYVGNFWCGNYEVHATQVREYFASKGLLVRMVFGRSATDDPHFDYKRLFHLYDFLVYFVRWQDAEDAISYCHREMYYGHRLNVFPGRVPVYFDAKTSVKHIIQQPSKVKITEQVFENYIQRRCSVEVNCVVKYTKRNLLVEYGSAEDRIRAIQSCRICTPTRIRASKQKQRFIEQDVQKEILHRLQNDRSFMRLRQPDLILGALFNGVRFNCYQWRYESKLKMPAKLRLLGPRHFRKHLHRNAISSALKYFGVKCICKYHSRLDGRKQERIQEPTLIIVNEPVKPSTIIVNEPVKPSTNDNPNNEVAVINTAKGSNIQKVSIEAVAPAVVRRQRFEDINFFEDSKNIDPHFGISF